jgi:hypothetical protein
LPELLRAFQAGIDEGLDNDGFSAALTDLVSTNVEAAIPTLQALIADSDAGIADTAPR